jgi:hypothetical protein
MLNKVKRLITDRKHGSIKPSVYTKVDQTEKFTSYPQGIFMKHMLPPFCFPNGGRGTNTNEQCFRLQCYHSVCVGSPALMGRVKK